MIDRGTIAMRIVYALVKVKTKMKFKKIYYQLVAYHKVKIHKLEKRVCRNARGHWSFLFNLFF